MNQKYFDKNEDICYKKLIDFNEHTGNFTDIRRQEWMSPIDVMATGKNNKEYAIELKYRENYDLVKKDYQNFYIQNDKGFEDNTLIIEPHKLCALLLDYVYDGKEPLYMNFFRNGYTTVHNVAKMKEKPKLDSEKCYKSNGYESFELSKRYLLPTIESVIYNDNYQLINTP